MRQPLYVQGPWRGIDADAVNSHEYMAWARNSSFRYGVAKQDKFTRAVGRPFTDRYSGKPSPIHDLVTVIYMKHRDGMDRFVAVGRERLYIVAANGTKIDVTGTCDWYAEKPSDVSWAQYTTDANEWIILASRLRNRLFRMASDTQHFVEFETPRGEDSSGIRGGNIVTVFGDRLVFGGVRTALSEIPHAVGWFGLKGPFDYTLPTSGYMALTDVPGRVTALVQVQDFLAVFKERGAYLLQRTFLPDIPFAAIPRLHTVGVSKPGHAVAVFQQSMIVFYSELTKRLYIWDLQTVRDVSRPVWRELARRENPVLYYNEHTGTLDVVYEDITLRYSVAEDWWTSIDTVWPNVHLPATVMRLGLTIDELVGTIDDQTVKIDDYPAAEVMAEHCYATVGGFVVEDAAAIGRTVWRLSPLVFPKPTTITSFEVHLRAPLGAIVLIRYRLDGDELWSRYISLEQGDRELGRYTHHFVETARQFEFEVAVEGAGCELVRWGVDVVGSTLQEDEVPRGVEVRL